MSIRIHTHAHTHTLWGDSLWLARVLCVLAQQHSDEIVHQLVGTLIGSIVPQSVRQYECPGCVSLSGFLVSAIWRRVCAALRPQDFRGDQSAFVCEFDLVWRRRRQCCWTFNARRNACSTLRCAIDSKTLCSAVRGNIAFVE